MAANGGSDGQVRPLSRLVRALRARVGGLRRWWLARGLEQARFPALPVGNGRDAARDALVFPPTDPALGRGVNLYGYIHGQFGLGQTARMYARALLDEGYPVAVNDAGIDIAHACNDQSLSDQLGRGAPYPYTLAFVNPDRFSEIAPRLPQDAYTIGFWFWELDIVPSAWMHTLQQVDEVWVSTSFVEEAFKRATDKPVIRIPHPIVPQPGAALPRSSFGLDSDAFVFLCSFDFNSSIHRKNPWAVLAAFRAAFDGAPDNVQLMMKCSNGFRYPQLLRELLKQAAGDRRILVRDQVLDDDQLHALQETADAYVSLHRAEGLGLGLAESMARGKPVIATAWSGNLDFMNDGNSCMVPFRKTPIGAGEYPFVDGGMWAEADVPAAAAWMVRLVREPGLAQRIGAQARRDILETMSLQAASTAMQARLQSLERQER